MIPTDQKFLLVKRLVEYLPMELSLKFIHQLFTNNINTAIEYSINEYKILIYRIYDKIPEYNHKDIPLLFTDMFLEHENFTDITHIITDNTNNIVHINSTSKESMNITIKKLFIFGFIPIELHMNKNKKIFNLKHYRSFHLAGSPLLSFCYN